MQPFTGNGDVSKWVKNSRVGRKTPNKQSEQTKKNGKVELDVAAYTFIIDVCHKAYTFNRNGRIIHSNTTQSLEF